MTAEPYQRSRAARVLIVDHDAGATGYLQGCLHQAGHRVCGTAPSGEGGVQRALELKPDLVLMRLELPGTLDGVDAADTLRRSLNIPVIFLSGAPQERLLLRAAALGFCVCLLEPVDPRELAVNVMMSLHNQGTLTSLERSSAVEERTQVHTARQRAARAEERVAARDAFLSLVAHELRTPLAALQLQVESLHHLVNQAAVNERVLTKVERCRASIYRLSDLLRQVLDVSRAASGRLSLEPQRFDLGACVQAVVSAQRASARLAGSEITLESQPVVGYWDRHRMHQIVGNLLSNAIKFGRGRPIEVSVTRRGCEAVVVLQDHGQGMSPQAVERIFHRFERAVSYRNEGGLGLSLFLARQIVELHGGRLKVSSTPGEGSTLTLQLPIRAVDFLPPPGPETGP